MKNLTTNVISANRVIVFTAAFIVIFCLSASNAFSVFVKPLQAATGGTAAQVLMTLTIYQFFMSLFGIISGKIVDKFGPKMLIYVGGLVFGVGWMLTGSVSSLPMLYLTCGFMAGAGAGLLYNPSINTALRWFPEKKGTISGVLLGAAALGPLVLAKAGAVLCDQFGTKGLIYIGIAYLAVIWLVGWKMVIPPKGWVPKSLMPPQISAGPSTDKGYYLKEELGKDYSPKEMVNTRAFWIMLMLFSIACTAGIMLVGNLSLIAQVQLGMTAVDAANMIVIICLANFFGRLILGRLCDVIGELKALSLIFIVTIIGLLGLKSATDQVTFIIFLILLGGSFGGVLVVYPPLTFKTFGVKNFGTNYGIMFFGYSIGAFVGPQIAARAVNLALGTSAYSQAYIIATAVAGIGLLVNLYFIRKQKNK